MAVALPDRYGLRHNMIYYSFRTGTKRTVRVGDMVELNLKSRYGAHIMGDRLVRTLNVPSLYWWCWINLANSRRCEIAWS